MSERDYAAFVERALFLDRPDPVAAWRELQRPPGSGWSSGWRRRGRSGSRPREPTCACASTGRTWINSDGRRNMPSGEVFTGPHRGLGQRDDPLHRPLEPARRRGRRRRADVRGRRGGRRHAPSAASDYLAGRARHRPRRPLPRRARDRHQPGHRPARPARSCSTRRWPAPSTSRSAARIPRPAARNSSALHWDLICDLRDGGRLTADGEPSGYRPRPHARANELDAPRVQ